MRPCANSKIHNRAFCFGLTLVLILAGCSQTPPDTRAADERAIRDLDAQWSKAAGENNLDGTLAFYSDDAVLMPPNAPLAADKAAIRASWAGLLGPGVAVSWEPTKVEVARSGDLAYVTGTYLVNMKDPKGNPLSERGKVLEVWKKQAGGNWKCAVDTYNPSEPPAKTVQPGAARNKGKNRKKKKK